MGSKGEERLIIEDLQGNTSHGNGEGDHPNLAVDRHLSKTLSYIFRYGAQRMGHPFLPGGFLFIDELLERHPGLSGYSLADIDKLVQQDPDKRFTLLKDGDTGRSKLRVNWSEVQLMGDRDMPLVEKGEIAVGYYCSSMLAWNNIQAVGLSTMGEQYIGLHSEVPDRMKPHWEVMVKVDIAKAQEYGYRFYRAPNGSILCPGNQDGLIPPGYFVEALHLDSGLPLALAPKIQEVLREEGDMARGDIPTDECPTEGQDMTSGLESTDELDSMSEDEGDTTLTDEAEPPEGVVTICQLRSGSVFRVPIKVQGQSLFAVVDTAAEVTLISEEVYRSLKSAPPVIKEVIMNTAGRGMQMNGYIVGPVDIELGTRLMQVNVYVAPIEDDMLLGFDLLRAHGIDLQMSEGQLKIGEEVVPMALGAVGQAPRVANVTLTGRVTVPPNSVMRVSCKISEELPEYIVEAGTHSDLLVPRTLHAEGSNPVVCLINTSDRHVIVRSGEQVARAIEVEALEPPPCINSVGVEGQPNPQEKRGVVPEHLQELFDRSKALLNPEESQDLATLLREFQDVFAINEFDLGDFSAIEHRIDTGAHPLIKQRMRRTPIGFAQEEEAHLKKMLEAGVIQPSTSDWCSVPVLVRKRDGGVRWCIDYRAVNAATVKDVFPLPLVEECLDTLAGNCWFSKLDANSAYWQTG